MGLLKKLQSALFSAKEEVQPLAQEEPTVNIFAPEGCDPDKAWPAGIEYPATDEPVFGDDEKDELIKSKLALAKEKSLQEIIAGAIPEDDPLEVSVVDDREELITGGFSPEELSYRAKFGILRTANNIMCDMYQWTDLGADPSFSIAVWSLVDSVTYPSVALRNPEVQAKIDLLYGTAVKFLDRYDAWS